MAKSKSKTFPKGTHYGDIKSWVDSQIRTEDEKDFDLPCTTTEKYLITITKLPEKGTILSPSYFPKGMREAYGKMKAVMDYIEENKEVLQQSMEDETR